MGFSDEYDSGMGEAIAADLLRGDAKMYQTVQGLVINAQQTGNWYYGDLIMRIMWALLPQESQREISDKLVQPLQWTGKR